MRQEVGHKYKPLFMERPRYLIMMGGRGAGRSTVASQFANAMLTSKEYFRCAIMRYVLGDIRNSIYREIKDRATETGTIEKYSVNDTTMTLKYGNNSINAVGFRKSSADQKAKLKSLANYNVIIIEEAEEILEEDFMQLDDSLRTMKGHIMVVMMLNPPPKNHWIIKRWFKLVPSKRKGFYIPKMKDGMEDTVIIRTNYKDNIKNISPASVKQYENYRTTKPDHYWNMIAGLVPEVLRGKIYNNWEQIDEIPEEARLRIKGLDFGYTNDPTALIDIYEWNNAYIFDEQVYQTGMLNGDIAKAIGKDTVLTIADSAEPKSIAEIQMRGVRIIGSKKGKGTVSQGIDSVQSKKIYVTKRSKNIWIEYENYAFFIDKEGTITNEPKDLYNHAMDAIRYAISFLNPIDEEEDTYEQPEHELPGLRANQSAAVPVPTLQTTYVQGATRQERMKKLLDRPKPAESTTYETDTPWQPPGINV